MNRKLENTIEKLYHALDNATSETERQQFRDMIDLLDAIIDDSVDDFMTELQG